MASLCEENNLQHIAIVGGGTAGWMCAAALAHFLSQKNVRISLIEASSIATVGVGEATIPAIRDFNAALGIDELEIVRHTGATFKLGIEFFDWAEKGSRFFHPFGAYGVPLQGLPFHQIWQRSRHVQHTGELADYCLPSAMARRERFAQPHPQAPSALADYQYALHLDALRYADFLRRYALLRGVEGIDARVNAVSLHPETGFITALQLDNGSQLAADFFVDCSGFKGLLISEALHSPYESWQHWLPCDRAVALQSESKQSPLPYTRAIARDAGWQWKIPLQHRQGNGYVYCSAFCESETASQKLLANLDGKATSPLKHFTFCAGKRRDFWRKNCIALGLAGGFLEPLESTSISLIQTGIMRFLRFYPERGINPAEVEEANRLTDLEYVGIRDFLLLHYCLSQRNDSDFWREVRSTMLPDSLAHKMELWRSRGHLIRHEGETFEDQSWISIYEGMGLKPTHWDLRVDDLKMSALVNSLQQMRRAIEQAANAAPRHSDFLARHCTATPAPTH